MKVALINPYLPYLTLNKRRHLGLAYLASCLRAHSHEVKIIDCQLYEIGLDKTIQCLQRFLPDLVGLSLLPASLSVGKELCSKIAHCLNPRPCIVVGNYLPTSAFETLMQTIPEVDMAIIGEGEIPLTSLCYTLENDQSYDIVPNLIVRKKNIERTVSYVRATLVGLMKPAEDDLGYALEHSMPPRSMDIQTSRGCRGSCTFCESPRFFPKIGNYNGASRYQRRPVQDVIDEFIYYIRNYQVAGFDIIDDDFLGDGINYAWEFVNHLKMRQVKTKYWFATRADAVNYELFAALKDSGLTWVFLGIESFVPRQLKLYGKDVSLETNVKAIQMLLNLGIDLRIGFIPIDPYTTLEELEVNLEWIRKLGLIDAIATPTREVRLYEKSPLSRLIQQDGLLLDKRSYDLTWNYAFLDQRIDSLMKESEQWYGVTYKCMMHFRELRDCVKTLNGTGIANEIKFRFREMKETELRYIEYLIQCQRKPIRDFEISEYINKIDESIRAWNEYCKKRGFYRLIYLP